MKIVQQAKARLQAVKASSFDPEKVGQIILGALKLRKSYSVTKAGFFFARVPLEAIVNKYPKVEAIRKPLQTLESKGIHLEIMSSDKHPNTYGWVAQLRGTLDDRSGETVADFEANIDTFSGTILVYEV